MTASSASVDLVTRGEEETEELGRRLGAALPPGTTLALSGPLGAGKTVFARGVAAGLGIDPAEVSSPTFVYLVDYPEGRTPFVHADLYRLGEIPPELAEEVFEGIGLVAALASDAVTLVEWWSNYRGPAPARLVHVELAVRSGDVRAIHLDFSGVGLDEARTSVEPRPRPGQGLLMSKKVRIVQKYGGTSVGTPDRIRAVAQRVKLAYDQGHDIAVVASAMSGETNRLLALAREVSPEPSPRELDSLVSTGEQVSCAMLAMALQDLGVPAVSLLGHQVRIQTDSSFGRARIESIDVSRIERAFAERCVAVVAGFQGVDEDQNITTLGRGGSDTTGVAIAAAIKADVCEILTDVNGVYTTDPRVCPEARKLARISYDEMLELASLGAKVLQIRSVEFAKRYQVPVHVRSSFDDCEGTWVVPEEEGMEEILVSGVAFERDQAKVTIEGVPDSPGLAASIFVPLADANIVLDMIVQNVGVDGHTDVTFTVPQADVAATRTSAEKIAASIGARGVNCKAGLGKVSVVGLGMRNHAGVAARMFEVLAHEGINIQMISTSEIKISVVVGNDQVDAAVRALHAAFLGPDAQAVRPTA